MEKKPSISVIMPMMGNGARMQGYQNTIKPLIKLPTGERMFERALSSLRNYQIEHLIAVIPKKYYYDFLAILQTHPEISSWDLVTPKQQPAEQVDTVAYGLEHAVFVNPEMPTVVLDCDLYANLPAYEISKTNEAAHLFVFQHNNPNKSFIEPVNEDGNAVKRIVEKEAISNLAVAGAYMFKNEIELEKAIKRGHQGYMSSVVMNTIEERKAVGFTAVEKVENYGTLEEYMEALGKPVAGPRYKGLLFDFDGTLFDTAELNWKAYQLAFFDLGVELDRKEFEKTLGRSVEEFNNILGTSVDIDRLKELKTHYYINLVEHAEPNPYLLKLIQFKQSDYKTAIVTTARKVNIEPLVRKYRLDELVDVIITQEDVVRHKPAPDAYEDALYRLGLKPEECLAFEDSRPGYVAAREAGVDCVRVPSGEFNEEYIKNMSGGSEAQTYLLFIDGRLVVRKIARTAQAKERLYNQYLYLMENLNDEHIIKPIRMGEEGKEVFWYDMDYYFAPALNEFLNKESVFETYLELIKNSAHMAEVPEIALKEDMRQKFMDAYVTPGYEIYQQYGGGECPIKDIDQLETEIGHWRKSKFHGDTTFENTLCLRSGELLMIDPVPDRKLADGLVHDFSKVAQSLMNYEGIRDGKDEDFTILRSQFNNYVKRNLTVVEYRSLKFYTACLFLRRLVYQVKQNPSLVKAYGDIGDRLLKEYLNQDYEWR